MADQDNKKARAPGQNAAGKFHYNPGNMAGKTTEANKPEAEQQANEDRIRSRAKPPQERSR